MVTSPLRDLTVKDTGPEVNVALKALADGSVIEKFNGAMFSGTVTSL